MTRPFSSFAVFNLRRKSLLRGNLLVLTSFAASFRLVDFPRMAARYGHFTLDDLRGQWRASAAPILKEGPW
jgi:hypothetical protein